MTIEEAGNLGHSGLDKAHTLRAQIETPLSGSRRMGMVSSFALAN